MTTLAYGANPVVVCNNKKAIIKNSWVLTHDSSVRVKQKREYSQVFYNNITEGLISFIKSNSDVLENIEIVSPILKYPLDIDNLKTLFSNVFNDYTYVNNSTTSNHIHFSLGDRNLVNDMIIDDGSKINLFTDPDVLFRLCKFWLYFEPLFMSYCARWRRGNRYCKSMHDIVKGHFGADGFNRLYNGSTRNINKWDISHVIACFQGDPTQKSSRYAAFNMLNLLGFGTIEIRIKHGSNDVVELQMFIKLFAMFLFVIATSDETFDLSKDDKDTTRSILFEASLEQLQVVNNLFFSLLHSKLKGDTISELTTLHSYFSKQLYMFNPPNPSSGQTGGNPISLFSYGSNGIRQLHERTGAQCSIQRGYLDNHVRIFAGYSKKWKGGVASIKRKVGEKLYGYITTLTPEQLEKLTSFEKGYSLVTKMINVSDTKRKKCWLFVKDNDEFVSMPSIEYMRAIRTMLNDCGRTKATNIMIRKVDQQKQTIVNLGYYNSNKDTILKNKCDN